MDSAWASSGTPVRWVVARIPVSPSFGGSTEIRLSEGNDFAIVVVLENSNWYERVLSSVYRLLQGLESVMQLKIKEH